MLFRTQLTQLPASLRVSLQHRSSQRGHSLLAADLVLPAVLVKVSPMEKQTHAKDEGMYTLPMWWRPYTTHTIVTSDRRSEDT